MTRSITLAPLRLVAHARTTVRCLCVRLAVLWIGHREGYGSAYRVLLGVIDRTGPESPETHAALGAMTRLGKEGIPT